MTRAAFGLGSNLGDRRAHLEAAVRGLAAAGQVLLVSSFRETEPVGGPPQPRYLNAAVTVRTGRTPRELLALAQELERGAGRTRGVRWGPRTLDVDLLLYGEQRIGEPDLVVPHPRLPERRFVLEPLAEIALDWPVPGTGRTVGELLEDLQDHP
ncbi:MAG TPA: 2-amino-4-hydroxy-6-hydroxymethyldihydropteridine diphosphokinase [Planctomycetota bacterium]|nr:2-amino-4-hydroxy-6-hydroxymethyldihydropteridine diphosphokinase [Planctomycetota bacterium]